MINTSVDLGQLLKTYQQNGSLKNYTSNATTRQTNRSNTELPKEIKDKKFIIGFESVTNI